MENKSLDDEIIKLWKSGKNSIMDVAVKAKTTIPIVIKTLTENGHWGKKEYNK